MLGTVVVATDGSESVSRAIGCALDVAAAFDATVHALYVADADDVGSCQKRHDISDEQGRNATETVERAANATDASFDVETAVRAGDPAEEIVGYVRDTGADAVAMGTRGRSGDHALLLGSVAEAVVRTCPVPVLTVRQLRRRTG